MSLLEDLKAIPKSPTVAGRKVDPEKDFTTKLEVAGSTAQVVLRDEAGSTNEGTARDFLESQGLNPDDYKVKSFKRSVWGSTDNPMESASFTFERIGSTEEAALLPDLDDLHEAIKRETKKGKRKPKAGAPGSSVICVLADFQVGKAQDERGGTKELLERSEKCLRHWREYVEKHRPEEIIIVDAGDGIENFESVARQERTNDLHLTEQLRVWRRLFWSWVDEASKLAKSVKVISVPSNHASVRRGKNNLGNATDDYGIETLSQLSDIASANPKLYGHIEFYAPKAIEESVAIQACGGKVIGVAHGHQVARPEKLPDWLAGQALGRSSIGGADIVFFGHFHNLRVQTVGDDRWMFIAPTMDAGSQWYSTLSGNSSAPGVLTMVVDQDGWRDLHIC